MKKHLMLLFFVTICSKSILSVTPKETTASVSAALNLEVARSFYAFIKDGSVPKAYVDPEHGKLGSKMIFMLPHGVIEPDPVFSTVIRDMTVEAFIRKNTKRGQTWHQFTFTNPDSKDVATFYTECTKILEDYEKDE